MADPFSVAGTAVGITSLGIQVCQGAFQYYARFRSYHNDIEVVVQRTEGLVRLLKTLDSTRKNIELNNDEPSEQLLLALMACDSELQKLQNTMKKFGQTKLPGSLQEMSGLVRKRLLWPFRKDTLLEIQTVLSTLQDNLHLALQIMDVHVAARHFTMLSGASESIIQTTNHINHQLNGQTQMLQFIHNQIETLAGRVDRHDALIGSYFPTRDEKRNTLYSNLDQQHTHHSSDMALMQQNSAWPTSLKARNHYQHISETRSRSMSSFLCRCPRPKSETRKTVPRTFAWFWTRDPIHLPGCVFYMHQKMASAFGTSFTVPGRNINRFVDMAWTWGAGPLSYHLTCRNIVSESSPAFQILWKLQSYIAQSRLHDRTYIVKPLTLTLQSLSTLLETNRVGASDVLQYHGYTLYHEAMRAIGSVMTGPNVELTSSWINEVSIFLQTLSAFGVPRNEKDAFGQTPLDSLFRRSFAPPSKSRILEISGLSGLDWSWSNANSLSRERIWSDEHYRRWSLIEASENSYMEEPLYLSILQQDYDGFITYLSERHISRVSEQYPLLLHAIIRWPEGVDTLLSRGFDTNNLDAHGYSALDLAIILEDVEAIDMLLQSDIHPTKYTWESSVLFFFRGNLQIRRTRLAQISQWLNRQALLDPGVNFISSDYISMVNKESPTPKMTTSSTKDVLYTLYHESGLDYLAARCLFEAGFRDIDVSATDGSYWAGTPLWTQACSMEIYNKEKVSLLAWLISKGANLQIEHWHLTAPVHAIFERIVGLRLSRFLGVPWNSFDEESVWRGDEFDDESVSDCDWEEYTLTDGAWMEEEIHNEKVPNGDFSGAEDYDVLVHAEGESERSEVRNDDGSEENGNQDDENVETSREDNIHDNGSYSAGREEDCRHSPENLECHDHKIPEVICMNDNRFEGNGNEPTPAPRSDNYSTRRVQHPFQVLVNQLWNSRTIDSCNCACSSHGCGIITSALKMTRHAFMDSIGAWRCTRDSRPPGDAQKKFFVIDYISRLSKYVDADIWVDDESCREALRVMTFDRLGLTHTCHNLGHSSVYCYPRNPLSQKEIEDIHYSEEKDLGLLEELVSEFESLWSQHPAGFTDFLRGRWTDRMDEVIAERSHPRDDEPGSVFRETGVILGPENLRDRRTRPKIGTLERFELDVWEIMNEVS